MTDDGTDDAAGGVADGVAGPAQPDDVPVRNVAVLMGDGVDVAALLAAGAGGSAGDRLCASLSDGVERLGVLLLAADAVVVAVHPARRATAELRAAWELVDAAELPVAVVVTGLGPGPPDFDDTLFGVQEAFGEAVLATVLPLHADDGTVAGSIDVLSGVVTDHTTGTAVTRLADVEHRRLTAERRAALIEAVLAGADDEQLLAAYVADDDADGVDIEELRRELGLAVQRGDVVPVVPVVAPTGVGTVELRELVRDGFPAPDRRPAPAVMRPDGAPVAPLSCDPAGPLCALVVTAGERSVVRVFSGVLAPGPVLRVTGTGAAVPAAVAVDVAVAAGRVATVSGLADARPGDTLCDPATPFVVRPDVG